LPGLALHHCANSAKVFTLSGTAGPILYVSIDFAAGETAVKSRSGS
jgi:hypothetical protein